LKAEIFLSGLQNEKAREIKLWSVKGVWPIISGPEDGGRFEPCEIHVRLLTYRTIKIIFFV
jgi:hypothetical protein